MKRWVLELVRMGFGGVASFFFIAPLVHDGYSFPPFPFLLICFATFFILSAIVGVYDKLDGLESKLGDSQKGADKPA